MPRKYRSLIISIRQILRSEFARLKGITCSESLKVHIGKTTHGKVYCYAHCDHRGLRHISQNLQQLKCSFS